MNRIELQKRTKKFNIDVLKLTEFFPRTAAGFELAKQLIRSAGSVGANYRASARAKSKADFIYKIEIVLEEADESMYWLEVILEANIINGLKTDEVNRLIREANELTAIFASADKTAKKQLQINQQSSNQKS